MNCIIVFVFVHSCIWLVVTSFVQRVNSIMFAKNDAVLVSGSYDKTVKVWDCRSRSIDAVQSMGDAEDSVSSVVVDVPFIYSASVDGRVRCYDVRRGKLTTDTLGVPVTSLALSHDGRCYLASTLDSTARLFDRSNGKLLATYTGHTNLHYVVQGGFAFDDAVVFSGSEGDGSLFAWDLVSSKMILHSTDNTNSDDGKTVASHAKDGQTPKTLCSLSMHPKHYELVSGSHDGTASLWRGPNAE